MDEFVKLLDPALNYVGHRVEEQKCVIIVESNRKEVTCPILWNYSIQNAAIKPFQKGLRLLRIKHEKLSGLSKQF